MLQRVLGAGDRLPEFELPALGGGASGPQDHRGRPLLIFFWGSW